MEGDRFFLAYLVKSAFSTDTIPPPLAFLCVHSSIRLLPPFLHADSKQVHKQGKMSNCPPIIQYVFFTQVNAV